MEHIVKNVLENKKSIPTFAEMILMGRRAYLEHITGSLSKS